MYLEKKDEFSARKKAAAKRGVARKAGAELTPESVCCHKGASGANSMTMLRAPLARGLSAYFYRGHSPNFDAYQLRPGLWIPPAQKSKYPAYIRNKHWTRDTAYAYGPERERATRHKKRPVPFSDLSLSLSLSRRERERETETERERERTARVLVALSLSLSLFGVLILAPHQKPLLVKRRDAMSRQTNLYGELAATRST